MIGQTWHVSTREAGTVPVSVKYRDGGKDLLVFMHGLGCAKESFDGASDAKALARYSLLTFDLPEHGESGSLGSRADIDTAAAVVKSLLGLVTPQRAHLVCHSMGGAIGLVAAQDLPSLAGFISVEGNLVAGDCGLVSRGIAEQSVDRFVGEGFQEFVTMLEASTELSHLQWAHWFKQSCPRGLHGLARSLVEWCDSDKLVGIFSSLESRAYVHGEWSLVSHLTERLAGIAVHSVTTSNHFPMLDNPDGFYEVIGEILDAMPSQGSPGVSVP